MKVHFTMVTREIGSCVVKFFVVLDISSGVCHTMRHPHIYTLQGI